MANSHNSKFLDDPEFQSLLVACLESLQRGEIIDHVALARDYPRFAAEVGQFLQDRQLLEKVAADFGDVEPSQIAISAYEKTVAPGSSIADFSIGDSIRYIGEYEILEEIARGGMGIVFKARQQTLNRIVALKMILAGKLADSSDVDRFQREAQAAGRLKHQNIVPVHEIGEHEGRHYFTMDFVEGESLADQIRGETLSPKAAARVVRTTAEAVEYAHSQGTVHRDLKPANLIIDQHGEPQITDFGLAKMLDAVDEQSRAELTATGQILGTPSYMSPEQAAGKQELVGVPSDVYSLGAILYASLTGRAPFVADSPVDTLLQVMKHDPVSPRTLNPKVPADLETICLKCLEKEPHKRYGTAQELAEDLQRYLDDRPIKARPADFSEKVTRWCRRNPAVASLLCLVFLSMATGTIVSAYYASVANYRANMAISAKQMAEHARESERKMRKGAEMMSEFAMTQQSQAHFAREMAEIETKRAKQQERLAESALTRSLYEQAKAVRLAGTEGHRWRSLELLGQSEGLRSQHAAEGDEDTPANMPKQWELRSEAVASLLTQDSRMTRSWISMYQAVDPQEEFAALLEIGTLAPAPAVAAPSIKMRLIKLSTGKTVGELDLKVLAKEFSNPTFAISPRGKTLASVLLTGIQLIDVKSGETVAKLRWPQAEEAGDEPQRTYASQVHMEFSPSGKQVVAFRSHDGKGETVIWDLPDDIADAEEYEDTSIDIQGRALGTSRASIFASPCFSPDGERVAYTVSKQKVVVDSLSGDGADVVIEIPEPMAPFGPLSFSDDGNSVALVTVSEKPRQSALMVWDLKENKQSHKIMTSQNIWLTPPKISPDQRYIATGTPQGEITIFSLEDHQAKLTMDHGGAVRAVVWASKKNLLSSAMGGLKHWELSLDQPIREVGTVSPGDFASTRFMFSRDGSKMVTTTGRGEMHTYNWSEAERLSTIKVPVRTTLDTNLGKNGQQAVVTGIGDPTGTSLKFAQLGILPTTSVGYNLETGEELFQREGKGAMATGIDDEGNISILSKKKNVLTVVNRETDTEIWSKTFDLPAGIEPVARISSDGKWLVHYNASLMIPIKQSTLEVWDLQRNKQTFSIQNDDDPITEAIFSIEGNKLLTLHNNQILNGLGQSSKEAHGTACVRDIETGDLKVKVTGEMVSAAAMNHNGSLLAVQFGDQQIEIWSVETGDHLFNWTLPDLERTFANNFDLEFTPDNQYLGAVVNSKGQLQFLDLKQVQELLQTVHLDWYTVVGLYWLE